MRILLVHNYYGSSAPSGENVAFELERALLERHGHDVTVYVRHSDDVRQRGWLGLVRGGASAVWNPWSAAFIRRVIADARPEVVHVHNTFPLISPGIFPSIGSRAARVLTLHNYRLFCPAAIPLRNRRPCTACLDARSVLPALRYGCYRGSRMATLPVAAAVEAHRRLGTWSRHVEAFVALTEFQREVMVNAGLPGAHVYVKPNFYPGRPRVIPWAERKDRVVFAGRLTEEKGVGALVDAWGAWGESAPQLRILGAGPLRADLEQRARSRGAVQVMFLGQVRSAQAEAEIAAARLVVLPSLWFEGFPMVLREAFALGTPAAVSDVGPLPGIVGPGRAGVVFGPNDPASLLEVVRDSWMDRGRLEAMGQAARVEYEHLYAEDVNYDLLIGIYRAAIAAQEKRET